MTSICTDPNVLANEERIVWLDHPENFLYVREGETLAYTRKRRPSSPGRLVAYSVLRSDARAVCPRVFRRRIWWVASHDPYEPGNPAFHPCEAVEPCSIRAGQASRYPHKAKVS